MRPGGESTYPDDAVRSGEWVPPGIDTRRPSSARVYDYLLGGGHNFKADRQLVERLLTVFPDAPLAAQANRAFLRRVVRFLVKAGVRQFLDVGSGIPTMGHVHEIAQANAPDARVVYVDLDPVAVAHSREIIDGNHRTAVVQEDIRRPEHLLDAPEVQNLINFDEPVALLLAAVLHYLPDTADPTGILARLTAPLVSGSYLAVSHATMDAETDEAYGAQIYREVGIDIEPRTYAEVAAMFDGFDLVEPGLVWLPEWHPDWPVADDPERFAMYGGVGRKP